MDHELSAITDYANNLGLLFQITDDLLDVTATAKDLGKTPGKDARSRKATFPSVYGIEVTRQTISAVHQTTCDALDRAGRPAELLRAIADFILHRDA
jgi:geranylgeranyl pyrophosphate synthase